MFKKILASLLGLFTIASASAATVNFCATNFVAGGSFTRPAIIQQVANKLPSDDAYVIVGQPLRLPATNGACWSVNLRYGTYRLDFEGFQFPKPLIFQVPNDTNTYSLLALAGLSPTNFIVASTS